MWKVTGDIHGNFKEFRDASYKGRVIILGDSGINYYVHKDENGEKYKEEAHCTILKKKISKELKEATFFCIQGNHEARAELVEGYKEIDFHGGKALIQEEYPNIIFAIDGEIYTFNGKDYLVIGGAYSIDKDFRLHCTAIGYPNYNWFPEEQPDEKIKEKVEKKLEERGWKIHGILSHTAPLKYEPTELFLSGVDQSKVDKSTEEWLDKIEEKTDYDIWYFGHYHGEKKIDKMRMLYHKVETLK